MITMGAIILCTAEFDPLGKVAAEHRGLDLKELLLGTAIVLAIGLALFLFIYLRSRKKSDKADQERLAQMTRSQGTGTGSVKRERRRKRHRRRDHRPRNPSLDKTGGLPPPRPDDQLPKF